LQKINFSLLEEEGGILASLTACICHKAMRKFSLRQVHNEKRKESQKWAWSPNCTNPDDHLLLNFQEVYKVPEIFN
jgi:hypothetical protein